MQANATFVDLSSLLANALGILAALLIVAVLTNMPLPFITSDRTAFFALAIIGFTMCAVGGIGKTQATLGWTHPITLAGIALGIVATLLIVAVLTDRTAVLTSLGTTVAGQGAALVAGERLAFLALAGIMLVKWVLGFGQVLLR